MNFKVLLAGGLLSWAAFLVQLGQGFGFDRNRRFSTEWTSLLQSRVFGSLRTFNISFRGYPNRYFLII